MPLPRPKSAITCILQHLTEHDMAPRYSLPLPVEMKQRAPRVEHRPARHANGPGGPTGYMRMGKCRARGHEPVDGRRFYLRVPESGDSIEPLIVGKEEKDIGVSRHRAILHRFRE